MQLRIAGITRESLIDGPGLRMVIFVQGCHFHCPGCHNPETHDPEGGIVFTVDELLAEVKQARYIDGVTFSGGEPFLQAKALAALGRKIKALGLSIVTYTGHTFEYLIEHSRSNPEYMELLKITDILVDGPYKEQERDLSLPFRGSRNQRMIDVPASLDAGRAVMVSSSSSN